MEGESPQGTMILFTPALSIRVSITHLAYLQADNSPCIREQSMYIFETS